MFSDVHVNYSRSRDWFIPSLRMNFDLYLLLLRNRVFVFCDGIHTENRIHLQQTHARVLHFVYIFTATAISRTWNIGSGETNPFRFYARRDFSTRFSGASNGHTRFVVMLPLSLLLFLALARADSPPQVSFITPPQLVAENARLTLECQATGDEPLQVEWKYL
jgi:hypothetical protein